MPLSTTLARTIAGALLLRERELSCSEKAGLRTLERTSARLVQRKPTEYECSVFLLDAERSTWLHVLKVYTSYAYALMFTVSEHAHLQHLYVIFTLLT